MVMDGILPDKFDECGGFIEGVVLLIGEGEVKIPDKRWCGG